MDWASSPPMSNILQTKLGEKEAKSKTASTIRNMRTASIAVGGVVRSATDDIKDQNKSIKTDKASLLPPLLVPSPAWSKTMRHII
jgi:hypothetical protein